MLKKVFHIVFAGIIFIISSGFSIQNHYCGGELAFTKPASVFNEKGCCGEQGLIDGCCKNEIKYFKISDYTQSSVVSISQFFSIIKLLLPTELFYVHNFTSIDSFSINFFNYQNKSSSPPLLYILHCILLI